MAGQAANGVARRYRERRGEWESCLAQLGYPREVWRGYVKQVDLTGVRRLPVLDARDALPDWDPFSSIGVPLAAEYFQRALVRHEGDRLSAFLDPDVFFAEDRIKAHYAALAAAVCELLARSREPFRVAILTECLVACTETYGLRDEITRAVREQRSRDARKRDDLGEAREARQQALKREARTLAKKNRRLPDIELARRLKDKPVNRTGAGTPLSALTVRQIRRIIAGIGHRSTRD